MKKTNKAGKIDLQQIMPPKTLKGNVQITGSPITLKGGVQENAYPGETSPITGAVTKLVSQAADWIREKIQDRKSVNKPTSKKLEKPKRYKAGPMGWVELTHKPSNTEPKTKPVYNPEYSKEPYIPKEPDTDKSIEFSAYTGSPKTIQGGVSQNVTPDGTEINLPEINFNFNLEKSNINPNEESGDQFINSEFHDFTNGNNSSYTNPYQNYLDTSKQARQEYNQLQRENPGNKIVDRDTYTYNTRTLSAGKSILLRGMTPTHLMVAGTMEGMKARPYNERSASGLAKMAKLAEIQMRMDKAHEAVYGPRVFRNDGRGNRTAVPWHELAKINLDNAFKYRNPPDKNTYRFPKQTDESLAQLVGIKNTDQLEQFIKGFAEAMSKPPGNLFMTRVGGGGSEPKTNGINMQATKSDKPVSANKTVQKQENIGKNIQENIQKNIDADKSLRDQLVEAALPRKSTIIDNKKTILDAAKKNNIPPELIGGILYNEANSSNIIFDPVKTFIKDNTTLPISEPTVGIAQVSAISALNEEAMGFNSKERDEILKKYSKLTNKSVPSNMQNILNYRYVDQKTYTKLMKERNDRSEDLKSVLKRYYNFKASPNDVNLLNKVFSGNQYSLNPDVIKAQIINKKNELNTDKGGIDYLGKLLNRIKQEEYGDKTSLTENEMGEITTKFNPSKGQWYSPKSYKQSFMESLPIVRSIITK